MIETLYNTLFLAAAQGAQNPVQTATKSWAESNGPLITAIGGIVAIVSVTLLNKWFSSRSTTIQEYSRLLADYKSALDALREELKEAISKDKAKAKRIVQLEATIDRLEKRLVRLEGRKP